MTITQSIDFESISSTEELHPEIQKFAAEMWTELGEGISLEQRKLLVDEAIFILDRLKSDYVLHGESIDQAVVHAIKDFGPNRKVAEAHIEGDFEARSSGSITRHLGRANAVAGAYIGIATFIYIVFLQVRMYLPSGAPLRLPLNPAQIRCLFPEPLPFPDASPGFAFFLFYPLIAPFFVGLAIGTRVPAKSVLTVCRVLALTSVWSFMFGCTLLPNTEGLLFAAWQLVFWLPVAALCAHASSTYVRQKRTYNPVWAQRQLRPVSRKH